MTKTRSTHPRNKYWEAPPDLAALAASYPSLQPYVVQFGEKRKRVADDDELNSEAVPAINKQRGGSKEECGRGIGDRTPEVAVGGGGVEGSGEAEQGRKVGFRWDDYNATRELTRVLLDHDFGVTWWIADGQLCPPVTNRANYIHWLQDLLAMHPAPWHSRAGVDAGASAQSAAESVVVRGLDVGTGANLIYPLLGASMSSWHFVATDVTGSALSGAQANRQRNPHLAHLIDLRCAKHRTAGFDDPVQGGKGGAPGAGESSESTPDQATIGPMPPPQRQEGQEKDAHKEAQVESHGAPPMGKEGAAEVPSSARDGTQDQEGPSCAAEGPLRCLELHRPGEDSDPERDCGAEAVLRGVVGENERFDFCMCNPPFFEHMGAAGANPRTACGGTFAEMVCPGGEAQFIGRMVQDSMALQGQVHWYTTMVGRKVNLKALVAELQRRHIPVIRTTEFVQGRTSRWGLAWSFIPMSAVQARALLRPQRTQVAQAHVKGHESNELKAKAGLPRHNFILEGLSKKMGAHSVLIATKDAVAGLPCTQPGTCLVSETEFTVSATLQLPGGASEFADTESPEADRRFSMRLSVMQHAPGCVAVSSKIACLPPSSLPAGGQSGSPALKSQLPSQSDCFLLKEVLVSLEQDIRKFVSA